MRIQNSLNNIKFGLLSQSMSVVMGFSVRTVFIYTLGIEYLGVDALFTSILLMLSLANVGFDSAMIYSLYKPLAEKDHQTIQALMNLYQRAYQIIGVVVLFIGLMLLPFLPFLMNGETTISNINLIYLLFLLHSVSSYYFVYKQSIIIADQRNHLISKIHSYSTLMSSAIQIILLLSTGNYIVVLTVQILFRIVENIYIANKANQLYPYIIENKQAKLLPADKKHFVVNLYSLFLYKISGVVINGTDNIIISIFVGVVWVGMYSNYLLIIVTLNTLLGYVFYSITASVGNLHVQETAEKQYFVFRVIHFANFWFYGFCAICLWVLFNPFISLWLGEQYVFDKFIVFAIVLNFFTAGMQNACTTFRETTGMFRKGKYRPVIAALINLLASIILIQIIGIAGVFFGTVISRLCTYFWYDPYVIFKFVFFEPVKKYFKRYMGFASIVGICAFLTDVLGSMLMFTPPLNLLLQISFCLVIPNLFFYIIYRKSKEFTYIWQIVKEQMKRIPTKEVKSKSI